MRIAVCAGVALLLGACAESPVRLAPQIAPDGEFRGPVVARRDMPLPARYEGYCEYSAGRWHGGGYRAYTPAPCGSYRKSVVVRAAY